MPTQTISKTQDKRQLILETARELLVRRGFQDVVLDDIAREADIAKGTLFLYFKSKEELFAAAFSDLADHLGEELEAVGASKLSGDELILETVRRILRHFDRYQDFTSNYMAGKFPSCGISSSKALKERFKRNIRLVGEIIKKASLNSGRTAFAKNYSSFALFSLCRSAAMMKNVLGSDYSLESKAREITDFFFHGLRGK